MFGAAGALVSLAPANRPIGIMSALTLLSVIAPAVPSAPQGSSGEATSGFQDLLAAVTGPGPASPETQADTVAAPSGEEDEIDAPVTAGFLAAPILTPPPPASPAPDSAADSDETSESRVADGHGSSHPGPASDDRSAAGANPPAAAGSGEVQSLAPLPFDRGPAPKNAQPQAQPVPRDISPPPGPPASETSVTVAETAAAAATEAGTNEAHSRTGTASAAAPPSTVTPPPLRQLAERTSRPLDSPTGKAPDGARAASPATSPAAPVAPTAAGSGSDQPARLADVVTAPAFAVAPNGEAEGALPDLVPAGEGAAAQAPASGRESSPSQLSRVTIEATAQIAAQILRKFEGRSTRFEMALTPDDLGRVDVRLDIDIKGRLNARLAFDNPAAATDLRGRADELRRQLEDAGFHLAEDAIEFAERDSGSSAFDRGQGDRDGQSRAFAAASRLNAEIDVAQPPRWMALSLSPSGVDMKV